MINVEDTAGNWLYKELFVFLTKQVSVPRNAIQLIQLGARAHQKKTEEIFHIYLLFERYLCSLEREKNYTRDSLRQQLLLRFPRLISEPVFFILFLSENERKNTLAIEFLELFLANISEKFGRVGNGYFENKSKELNLLYERKQEADSFRELQFMCFDAFQFLNENYGVVLAGKLFEKTYETLSFTYKELETFPHLISLIPKEIISREHLGIFTQLQIEQVFLEKLTESEELNLALDEKIRENEEVQKQLNKNKIMMSSVINSAPEVIVIANQEGRVIYWNHAATSTYGFTEEEAVGKLVTENICPVILLRRYGFDLHRFLSNPKSKLLNKRLEVMSIRRDGTWFPAELTLTTIRYENEFYFNGFIRDISERKRKERELLKTKEKAEQAAKAKAQFLSVMSHEIRTPLNAIIGFTQLLLQNQPRKDQKNDLKMLQFSGENLLNITNDILDFSKLESGKVELSFVDFNLRELIQSLYQSFSYVAKEKDIVFDVEYDEKMPFIVRGDSLRISQILNNLISNAIKFTGKGRVTLKVEMEEDMDGSLKARFSVIDTGIGIPAEKHNKIFEQFTQANSDTTRLFGGTGLGLAICGKLAELMKSKIILESIPDQGSTFYFTVLFQKSDAKQAFALQPKADPGARVSFEGMNLLLAEDNLFNANIARRYINSWGATLDVALDGEQAFEFALRNKYDLILMDVQMPVLDGFACTKAIRRHLPDIPIIAITASPINEVLEEIKASGMNDYVSKPFKPGELHQMIAKFLVKK